MMMQAAGAANPAHRLSSLSRPCRLTCVHECRGAGRASALHGQQLVPPRDCRAHVPSACCCCPSRRCCCPLGAIASCCCCVACDPPARRPRRCAGSGWRQAQVPLLLLLLSRAQRMQLLFGHVTAQCRGSAHARLLVRGNACMAQVRMAQPASPEIGIKVHLLVIRQQQHHAAAGRRRLVLQACMQQRVVCMHACMQLCPRRLLLLLLLPLPC